MFPLTPDQHHWLDVAMEDEGWCSFRSCTPSRSRARTLNSSTVIALINRHYWKHLRYAITASVAWRRTIVTKTGDWKQKRASSCFFQLNYNKLATNITRLRKFSAALRDASYGILWETVHPDHQARPPVAAKMLHLLPILARHQAVSRAHISCMTQLHGTVFKYQPLLKCNRRKQRNKQGK